MRILIGLIILSSLFVGCTKCSKDEAPLQSQSGSQADVFQAEVRTSEQKESAPTLKMEQQKGQEGAVQNVKFVQTPDGRMVPEPALKLKVPNLLNPQILKNAIKQQNEDLEKKADIKE